MVVCVCANANVWGICACECVCMYVCVQVKICVFVCCVEVTVDGQIMFLVTVSYTPYTLSNSRGNLRTAIACTRFTGETSKHSPAHCCIACTRVTISNEET